MIWPLLVALSLQHVRIAKLPAKIWPHFISPRKLCSYRMGELGLLLGKMDRTLAEMSNSIEAFTDGCTLMGNISV
ncbi:hypothetical protein RHGRI_030357 [Rhododendron griersonianum]|uniref:Uncharacterized protein n=1 Tax=Rhododendron griersonianum TaxID=479676 RepID=A0AAV6INV4_9ERIC|nr:hypothetical protein RHGRI_030357 [Rhododendron griersonianum]